MPAYNEGHHIYKNLEETHRVFKRAKCEYEIVLVDDGSDDNTFIAAKNAARDLGNIKPVSLNRNRGKGNALKEGFKHAVGDYVIFLDADLDLHPGQLHQMFKVMRDKQAEVIIGSKYHPESKLDYPGSRKVFSRTYALALKALFGLPLRDTQTGLKIFKREVLDKVFPHVICRRYAFDVELLANAHHAGYKVIEAPVVLNYRREMKWGRIGLKDMLHMGLDTLGIFYRISILKQNGRLLPQNSIEGRKDYRTAR